MKVKFNDRQIELGSVNVADYLKISDNQFKFNINGRMTDCFAEMDETHIHIFIEGRSYSFEKVKVGYDFEMSAEGVKSDREEIKPPMPGSVVKLLVENGQEVSEGEGLIIVEAMKMETTIYTSISGVVSEISVEAGQQVDANKILLVIEKENQSNISS
jgi:biotin carboxyl carrier protein